MRSDIKLSNLLQKLIARQAGTGSTRFGFKPVLFLGEALMKRRRFVEMPGHKLLLPNIGRELYRALSHRYEPYDSAVM
jgi:hypothetical protein